MSNATLEMMQEIEQAAQGVIVGYEAQVEQIRTDSRDRLATVAQHYDEETKQLVTEAEKDVEETVARNDARVQEAMTDKRAGLVEAIVEKVVASYGR